MALLALPSACSPSSDARVAQPTSVERTPQEELEELPSRAELQKLQRLGYAGGLHEVDHKGVEVHVRDRVASGANLFTSGHGPEAVLTDMDGRVLHRWRCPPGTAWPAIAGSVPETSRSFRRARLLPGGSLLVIFEGIGIVRLSRDSEVTWAERNGAHHDLEVQPNGDVYVLTRTAHVVPRVHPSTPFLEDFVSVLDPSGREKRRVSLLECFENSGRDIRLRPGKHEQDPFHTNSLVVLDELGASSHPRVEPGMVLVSIRNRNLIAVLDLEREALVLGMTGSFRMQHDPTFVARNRLLVFDNLGLGDRSRILELGFRTGRVHWTYSGTPEDPFFSRLCGTAQRLSNGNTLITESTRGRAFEVDREGEILWEFHNPHRAGEDDELIAELFEVLRIEDEERLAWLATGG